MPGPIIDAKFREDFLTKKFSLQEHELGRSVFMTAIWYSGAISAASTYEQLLWKESMCVKFQNDVSRTERLVSVSTDKRIDRRTWLNRLNLPR